MIIGVSIVGDTNCHNNPKFIQISHFGSFSKALPPWDMGRSARCEDRWKPTRPSAPPAPLHWNPHFPLGWLLGKHQCWAEPSHQEISKKNRGHQGMDQNTPIFQSLSEKSGSQGGHPIKTWCITIPIDEVGLWTPSDIPPYKLVSDEKLVGLLWFTGVLSSRTTNIPIFPLLYSIL